MKKLLLILLPFFFLQKALCQPVVFCPPGAEWHYLFTDGIYQIKTNEEVKYIKDSLMDQEVVKVLKHRRHKYYLKDNFFSGEQWLNLYQTKRGHYSF